MKRKSATAAAAKAKGKAAKGKAAAHKPHHPAHHHAAHHPAAAGKPGPAGGGGSVGGAAKGKPAPKRVQAAKRAVHKRRGLALPGDVACCAAEAVAASLRLTGRAVSDRDVLALHRAARGDDDAGAVILAALEAAAEFGVAGLRPASFAPVDITGDPWCLLGDGLPGVILGIQLPAGPHTVCDDGRSWWSWGELYDPDCFPGAVIEEAWAVTWS